MEEHEVIVEQDSSGGYVCTECGDPAVLITGIHKWAHKDPRDRRAVVKTFIPELSAQKCKNRREALYSAVTLVSLDGYGSSDNALVTAELFERWLNRPEGEWWHPDDNGPTQLHVIEDEVQDLP